MQCSLPTEQLFNPLGKKSPLERIGDILNDLNLDERSVITLKDVSGMNLQFVDVFEVKPQAQFIVKAAEEVIEVF